MPLEITSLKRVFKFKKDGEQVTLEDPDSSLSVEDAIQFYAPQYPELTTATLEGPKIENKQSVYTVKTTVGTKG